VSKLFDKSSIQVVNNGLEEFLEMNVVAIADISTIARCSIVIPGDYGTVIIGDIVTSASYEDTGNLEYWVKGYPIEPLAKNFVQKLLQPLSLPRVL
jgi:hypothetical protein